MQDPPAGPDEPDDVDGPPARDRVFDRGLQHERTALAWDRTGLAMLVVGALVLRGGGPPYDDVLHVPAYLAMGAGAILLWAGGRRYDRREVDLRAGRSVVRPGLIALTGFAAVGISFSALVLILLP
jgi:hypothetical protein